MRKQIRPKPQELMPPPSPLQPTPEQIARRAYEIFLSRGGAHGRHLEDWLEAERQLRLGRS